ncbi:MAG: type II toxin-antitoxin system Phd/YefM family antitoxin [Nitrospirae bacterium]|nr:type II toxin-antitoxin system Phd/YefM family antitoxin [Nitrospirota bacterium]
MPRTIPLSEAKAHLSEIVKDVSEMQEIITISKGGVPATVMMSMDEYESLIETLEILSDPEMMAALREAEEERKAGKVLTEEEFWREVRS